MAVKDLVAAAGPLNELLAQRDKARKNGTKAPSQESIRNALAAFNRGLAEKSFDVRELEDPMNRAIIRGYALAAAK